MKKHPISDHLADVIHAARYVKSGANHAACLALDDYILKLRIAGYELKHCNNGPAFLVNNNDPYDMLSSE